MNRTASVAVIGAGPIGLAAAANLAERGMDYVVLEAGKHVGTAVEEWGHVRLFSPWSELIDPRARRRLEEIGWSAPGSEDFPTGSEWAAQYLQPLAETLNVRLQNRVVAVSRRDRDRVVDADRGQTPFVLHLDGPDGRTRLEANSVIDATGTWNGYNPLGAEGLPAIGENHASDRISYRVPDLSRPETRDRYAGRHVVVAGTGASAKTALVALTRLTAEHPSTHITWLVRRGALGDAFGGEAADDLVARGALGSKAREAVEEADAVTTMTGFRTVRVVPHRDTLTLHSSDGQLVTDVDEVIALTGFRPDFSLTSEIRLDLDATLQAPRVLAPKIDPNVHSCGSVEPHGFDVLQHPEPNFFTAGMKSYGRATSFLALTGFEQVRSIVAHLAGDHESAANVELTLPETGVCGGAKTFEPADAAGDCCAPTFPTHLIAGSLGRKS